MDKVSVIMPVYNTPFDYISKAVESILQQTYRDIEFIIYDDGSDKETKDHLTALSQTDDRIVLILCNENHGLSFALNRCLERATGKYVARMDSDDYCDYCRLEKQLEYLNEHSLDVVGCNMFYFDESGVYAKIRYNQKLISKDFLFGSPISHPTIVAKKESFDTVGGYREEPWCLRNEDYDLFMRMQAAGLQLGNLNKELYFFREDSSAIARRKYKYRINEFKVRKKGFHQLHLYPKGFFYLWKPLIIGILPKRLYKKVKQKNKNITLIAE